MLGVVGAAMIVSTHPTWPLAANSWRVRVPGSFDFTNSSAVAIPAFIIGTAMVCAAWMLLIRSLRDARDRPMGARIGLLMAVTAIWLVPVLIGPPLFSNDVYSYAAQGEVASRGMDPTSTPPLALNGGPFLTPADPVWRDAVAPYGPIAIEIGKRIVSATEHDPAASVWLFRVVIMFGVGAMAVGVFDIARTRGKDPATAVAIGVANPIVLFQFVGGIHNDALMAGALILGVAAIARYQAAIAGAHTASERSRAAPYLITAFGLITIATAIKIPAAVGLLYIGWIMRDSLKPSRRLARGVAVLVAGFVVIGAFGYMFNVGWGWIGALRNTGSITSTLAPVNLVSLLARDTLEFVGLQAGAEVVYSAVRLLGLAVTGVVAIWLLRNSDRFGAPHAIGMTLLIAAILSPVIWPWYFAAGFALVAAAGLGRFRPSAMTLTIAVSFVVWPTGVSIMKTVLPIWPLLGLMLVILIAGLAVFAQRRGGHVPWLVAGDDDETVDNTESPNLIPSSSHTTPRVNECASKHPCAPPIRTST